MVGCRNASLGLTRSPRTRPWCPVPSSGGLRPGCRRGSHSTPEPVRSCTPPAASCRRDLTSTIPRGGRTGHCSAPSLPGEDSPTSPRPLQLDTGTRTSARARSRGSGVSTSPGQEAGGVCTRPTYYLPPPPIVLDHRRRSPAGEQLGLPPLKAWRARHHPWPFPGRRVQVPALPLPRSCSEPAPRTPPDRRRGHSSPEAQGSPPALSMSTSSVRSGDPTPPTRPTKDRWSPCSRTGASSGSSSAPPGTTLTQDRVDHPHHLTPLRVGERVKDLHHLLGPADRYLERVGAAHRVQR